MSDWYFWDPVTDKLTKAKYDILRDPKELWEPEMRALSENRKENLRVGDTWVREFWLSTVFLGLDHGWGHGDPVLFESMVFHRNTGGCDYYSDRYCTSSEAKKGHEKIKGLSRWLLLKAPRVSGKTYKAIMRRI